MSKDDLVRTAHMFLAWEITASLLVSELAQDPKAICHLLLEQAKKRRSSGDHEKCTALMLDRLAYRLDQNHKGKSGDQTKDVREILRALSVPPELWSQLD